MYRNKVILGQERSVLGLITFVEYTILVFSETTQANSAWLRVYGRLLQPPMETMLA